MGFFNQSSAFRSINMPGKLDLIGTWGGGGRRKYQLRKQK